MAYKEIYISKETYENLHIARNVLYEGFVINYGYAYAKAVVIQPSHWNGYNPVPLVNEKASLSSLHRIQQFDDSIEARKLSLRGLFYNGEATIEVAENMNLSVIAELFDVTINDLVSWNNIKNENLIFKGQKIKILKEGLNNSSTPFLMKIYNFIMSKPTNDAIQTTGIAATIIQTSNISFYYNSMNKPVIFKGCAPSNAIKVANIGKALGYGAVGVSIGLDILKYINDDISFNILSFNTLLNGVASYNPYFGVPYALTDIFYPGGFVQAVKDRADLEAERSKSMGNNYKPLCVKSYQ